MCLIRMHSIRLSLDLGIRTGTKRAKHPRHFVAVRCVPDLNKTNLMGWSSTSDRQSLNLELDAFYINAVVSHPLLQYEST